MTLERFRGLVGEEEQCWEQWRGRRWPRGFRCRRCGGDSRGSLRARHLDEGRACGYPGWVTAGTIFHKTRVPLRDWFWAISRMSQGKKGIWALPLSKEIGVRYATAWRRAHKLRQARGDGEQGGKLRGRVEADEGEVGGKERGGGRSGRAAQTKSRVAVAGEHWKEGEPGCAPIPGRAALAVMPEVSTRSVRQFLESQRKPRTALWTEGWPGYGGLSWRGFPHAAIPWGDGHQRTQRFFPWGHILLSNLKRFLLGTHHQPQPKHLARDVAEFTSRFNRRWQERSLFHRLTRAGLATSTITYKDFVAQPELA